MLRLRSLAIAAFAACCAAASIAPTPVEAQMRGDWRALLGCYRIADWVVALDSVPHVGLFADEDESRRARTTIPNDTRTDKMWRMPAPDSVRLRLEDGLHGSTYELAVRGDTLEGRVLRVTDVVLPGSRGPRWTQVRGRREPCPADSAFTDAPPDSATLAVLHGYSAARPTWAALEADPAGSVAPLRAWLAAHPEALRRHVIKYNAQTVFSHAASLVVAASALELVGTYRFDVSREGGPSHVFYGRTEPRPWRAERHDTLEWQFERPTGYLLHLSLALDSASLPRPGPVRRHRDALGSRGPRNSEIFVRLPAADSGGGVRFAGSVMLLNFAGAFDDAELEQWDETWYRRHRGDGAILPLGEFVLLPDGRVTFTQREALDPGQALTIRGERISRETYTCREDGCW